MTREEYKNRLLDKNGIYYQNKEKEVRDSVQHTINLFNRLGLLGHTSIQQIMEAIDEYVVALLTNEFKLKTITDSELAQAEKDFKTVDTMTGIFGGLFNGR